jgi:nicotinamide mononucleotide adenylyltransferase
MKSFSQLVQEASAPKTRVVLFGRMNPPTAGHEENVLNAHKVAEKHAAELHIVASHSHDDKKNPLTITQKLRHLKRAFGHLSNTSISTSTPESPSILSQAVAAHKAGIKHFIMAGGGDRAAGYHKLLKQYNGVKGKPHGYYKFDKISIANTGARREGISGTDMRRHAQTNNFAKFQANLPSKIKANATHAQELFKHVQAGLTKSEDLDREDYIQGRELSLGTLVEDLQTGLQGQIVYRGPTYVTIQINEDLSFKRWIADVQSLELPDLPATPTRTFKTYVTEYYPADVRKQLLDRVSYCPSAQKEFGRLLDDHGQDQGVVLEALDATAHYLDIEKFVEADRDRLDDHAITQFVEHMRHAATLLKALGDLPAHESYMEKHTHIMMNFIHGNDPGPKEESTDMDRFKTFVTEKMQKDEAESIAMDDHLTDNDLKDIEKHIDQMEWEDVRHILGAGKQKEDQGAEATDEDFDQFDLDSDILDEDLTALQRMNKKFVFMKSKAKRQIALRIALKRPSGQKKLKSKAIVHARRMIKAKLLRGRDYAKLSAAEKNRIENILKRASQAVTRISNRLVPKIRELESKRLKRMHEQSDTVSSNAMLAHTIQHLAGYPRTTDPTQVADAGKTMRRMKQFRKMEV